MSNEKQKEYLSFNIQEQSFCIKLEDIHEVITSPFITIVPTLNEFIGGIINYRGNIIEVFNLHK
jgi:chemotaxis signal transduction protein